MPEQAGGGGVLAILEKPWYSLLDLLDSKGLPVYKVVDPIDQRVPSVLVALGLLLLLVIIIAFLLLGGGKASITITALADNKPLGNVTITAGGLEATTGKDGTATLQLPKGTAKLKLTRENCKDKEVELEVTGDDEREIDMDCQTSAIFGGCLELPETLATAKIVGEDNAQPTNCRLTATAADGSEIDTGWTIDGDELSFSAEKCVDQYAEIFIDCDAHSRQATADEIATEAKTDGSVLVYAKNAAGLEAEITHTIYVTVENSEGQTLEGMRVLAVDSMGNEYITGYRNTITSDATNIDGNALLKMADGLEFVIRAEDPNAEYAPVLSSLLKADDDLDVKLVMEKGEQSTILVKEKDGGGISGAPVVVKQDGVTIINGRAEADGTKKVALLDGQYTAESAPNGYVPGSTQFSAGKDATIELEKIPEGQAGIIKITAVAPDEVPLPNVRVLLDYNGITAGDCVTTDTGKCVFEEMAPGTYGIAAVAPSTHNPQQFGELQLEAAGVVEKTIVVSAKNFTLTARAKTLTEFISGAKVTMSSRATTKKLDEKTTAADGKAAFQAYLGQAVYLEAGYKDYPAVSTGTIVVTGNHEELMLFVTPDEITDSDGWTQVTADEKFLFTAPAAMSAGGTAKATVQTAVSPDKAYKETIIEVWSGEPGSKENPLKTPVEIGSISGSAVKTSDEYTGEEPALGEPGSTAKYVRMTLTGSSQSVTIPLAAKKGVEGATTVHCRIRWETEDGQVIQSEWTDKGITLSEAVQWVDITNAIFSAYKAGFGAKDAPESEWTRAATLSPGATTYIHVIARAKKDSTSFTVQFDSRPPAAGDKHMAMRGYEVDGAAKELPSNLPQVASIKSAVKTGQDKEFMLRVQALTPVEGAKFMLFGDTKNALVYTVDNTTGPVPTPIEGVEAIITPQAMVCPPQGLEGSCQWGTFSPFELLGSLATGGPRDVRIEIEFSNSGNADAEFPMAVDAPGIDGLDYTGTVTVQAGGTAKATITGKGRAAGDIRISLDGKAWQTIRHGLVDYSIEVTGGSPLTSQSTRVNVRPLRNSQLMQGAEVTVEGKAAVPAGGYYTSEGMRINLEQDSIPVAVSHREFGTLTDMAGIAGLFIRPSGLDYSIALTDSSPDAYRSIATVIDHAGSPAIVTISGTLDTQSMDVFTEIAYTGKDGQAATGLEDGGTAEVYLGAKPTSLECNSRVSSNTVTVTASTPGLTKKATYFVNISCSLSKLGGTGSYVVFRESGDIERGSCQLIGDTAYLCDAQQLSTAIILASKNLYESAKEVETHTYAFGNDYINPKVVTEAGKLIKTSYPASVVSSGDSATNALSVPEIKCGIVKATFKKLDMGRIQLDAAVTDAPWCKQGPYYFTGALNKDEGMIGAADFVKPMAASTASQKEQFLGITLAKKDGSMFIAEYRDMTTDELAKAEQPKYSWLQSAKTLPAAAGYFNALQVQEGADFVFGTLGGGGDCFLKNLEHFWTTGKNDYISRSIRGGAIIADLAQCTAPPAVNVPAVAVQVDDSKDTDVHSTSDTQATVAVASTGSDCLLVMEDRTGNSLLEQGIDKTASISLPDEDYLLFKASCKDTGYAKWATTYIVKDSTPPAIQLPALSAIYGDVLMLDANVTDNFGVESCKLEIAPVGTTKFTPTDCAGSGEQYSCKSSSDEKFPDRLPGDKYTLLEYNVKCTDINKNVGTAGGSVYYYPNGLPNIAVDTSKTLVKLIEDKYYYTAKPVDTFVIASSTSGITGCTVKDPVTSTIKDCVQQSCTKPSQEGKCLEASFKCLAVTLLDGHNPGYEIACAEAAAEGETPQITSKTFDFVLDRNPPTVTATSSEYNVTSCAPPPDQPWVKIKLVDNVWFDDQQKNIQRTECNVSLLKKDGTTIPMNCETSTAVGKSTCTGQWLNTSAPDGEYLFKTPAKLTAVDMAQLNGIDPATGKNSSKNYIVDCRTVLYNASTPGMRLEQQMLVQVSGKIPAASTFTVLGQPGYTDLPTYLLPPDPAKAAQAAMDLGAYCYSKAYNIKTRAAGSTAGSPGDDDSQKCFYVSFAVVRDKVQASALMGNALADGTPADRGPMLIEKRGTIGDMPKCSEDCVFAASYANATWKASTKSWDMPVPQLVWFNDTGWRASDYSDPKSARHRNDLVIGGTAAPPTIKWGTGYAGLYGDPAGCVGAPLPTTDPDSDDWIMPTINWLKAYRQDGTEYASTATPEVYRTCRSGVSSGITADGDTTLTFKCNATDPESNQLNYWFWFAPLPTDKVNLTLATTGSVFEPRSTAMTAFLPKASGYEPSKTLAVGSSGEFKLSAANGFTLGNAMELPQTVKCRAEDQDWNETGDKSIAGFKIKNSKPKNTGLSASPTKIYWMQTSEISCNVDDCEEAPQSLKVQISYSKHGSGSWNDLTATYSSGTTYKATFEAKLPPNEDSKASDYSGLYDVRCTATDSNTGKNETVADSLVEIVAPHHVEVCEAGTSGSCKDNALIMYTGGMKVFSLKVYDASNKDMSGYINVTHEKWTGSTYLKQIDTASNKYGFYCTYTDTSNPTTGKVTGSIYGVSDDLSIQLKGRVTYGTIYGTEWDTCKCKGGSYGGISYTDGFFTWPAKDIDTDTVCSAGCGSRCLDIGTAGGVSFCWDGEGYTYKLNGGSTHTYAVTGRSPRNPSPALEDGKVYTLLLDGGVTAWGTYENCNGIPELQSGSDSRKKLESIYGSCGGGNSPYMKVTVGSNGYTFQGTDVKYNPADTVLEAEKTVTVKETSGTNSYVVKNMPHQGTSVATPLQMQIDFIYNKDDKISLGEGSHGWTGCTGDKTTQPICFSAYNIHLWAKGSSGIALSKVDIVQKVCGDKGQTACAADTHCVWDGTKCAEDKTLPVFAGVTSASYVHSEYRPPGMMGPYMPNTVTVSWGAATDSATPITYYVYEKVGTGSWNAAGTTQSTSKQYGVADGQTYTFKVTAVDAMGNKDTNTVEKSVVIPAAAAALSFSSPLSAGVTQCTTTVSTPLSWGAVTGGTGTITYTVKVRIGTDLSTPLDYTTLGTTTTTSYTHTHSYEVGKYYYYLVDAADSAGSKVSSSQITVTKPCDCGSGALASWSCMSGVTCGGYVAATDICDNGYTKCYGSATTGPNMKGCTGGKRCCLTYR